MSVNGHPAAGHHTGDIIVSDTELNSIAIINESGRLVGLFDGVNTPGDDAADSTGTLLNPTGVCCDRSGNIIVCDSGHHRVILLNSSGQFVLELLNGDDVTCPQDVCLTSRDELVVIELGGMVRVYTYKEIITLSNHEP